MTSHYAHRILCVVACFWLMLVQPGLSYFWLIDPDLHAQIDAERYGQALDGEALPESPRRPLHDHPFAAGIPIPATSLRNAFDAAFYTRVFSAAHRPSLGDHGSKPASPPSQRTCPLPIIPLALEICSRTSSRVSRSTDSINCVSKP
jgi:hypothetical protein